MSSFENVSTRPSIWLNLLAGYIHEVAREFAHTLSIICNFRLFSMEILGDIRGDITTESPKLLQGDVGELFLGFLRHVTKSHYYYL